jgi:hypothetical protein
MRYILTIAVAMFITSSALSQNDSGIYLAVKCARGSTKQTALINHKAVCLAPSPIILPTQFVSITELQVQGDRISFDLIFSQKAVKTMSQIATNLPSANFALVVQKDVFTTFPANELAANRTFRFQGNAKDYPTFSEIQKRLKALISSSTPQ